MALPQLKQDATEARIGTLSLPQGGWSATARSDALARVRAMGLPSRRDEYWKYTRPDTLVDATAPAASLFDPQEEPIFGDIDRLKIVFVDGVFDADASDDLSLDGIEIERLATSAASDIHWAKDIYGALEVRGQDPVERPLAALNTAFATDGILVHVKSTPSKPISLIYVHSDEGSDAILHHVIKVDSGATVTVLENGPAAARFNKCMEIDLADTATLHHVRAQGREHERRAATHMLARLGT